MCNTVVIEIYYVILYHICIYIERERYNVHTTCDDSNNVDNVYVYIYIYIYIYIYNL